QLPRHSHEHAYFCLVRRGSYTEAYGNRSRACGPLTLAFHPPDEVHSEQFDNREVRSLNIELTPGWREETCGNGILEGPVDFRGGAAVILAMKLYHEFQHMDNVSPLVIEGLTLEILAELSRWSKRTERRTPAWLERIRNIVHARFNESLRLRDL